MTRANPWFEMDLKEDADFDAVPGHDSWIERLTGSTLFGALLGIALLITVPIVLLGLVLGLPVMLAALVDAPSPWMLPVTAAILGGGIGMLGLLRSRRTAFAAPGTRATIVMLAIGVATAVAMIAAIVAGLGQAGFRGNAVAVPGLALCACLAILGVEGIAEIVRAIRLASPVENPAAGRTESAAVPGGHKRDALPWIFLGIALAQVIVAAAINVSLA